MRNDPLAAQYATKRRRPSPSAFRTGRGAVPLLVWVGIALLWAGALTRLPDSWDKMRAAELEQRLRTPECREPEGIIAELAELGPVGLPAIVRALADSQDGVVAAAQRAIRRGLRSECDFPGQCARLDVVARTLLAEYPHWGESARNAADPLLRAILDSPGPSAMIAPRLLERLKALTDAAVVRTGGDPALSGHLAEGDRGERPSLPQSVAHHDRPAWADGATRIKLESGSKFAVRADATAGSGIAAAGFADGPAGTVSDGGMTSNGTAANAAWSIERAADEERSRSQSSVGALGIDQAVYAYDTPSTAGPRSFGPAGREIVRWASDDTSGLETGRAFPVDGAAPEGVEPQGGVMSEGRAMPGGKLLSEGNARPMPMTASRDSLAGHTASGGSRGKEIPPEFAIPPEIRDRFLQLTSGLPEQRPAAAEALQLLVRSPGVIRAGEWVFNPSPQRRREAVTRLWTIPDIDPLPFLFELAVDPDPAVRRDALVALGSVTNDAIRNWVVSACRLDASPEIRAMAETIGGPAAAAVTQ
ncbi:MAG: HEAT repeat domain-containing protein [Thermogutta sp.]